jgi:hypothetical protein
LHLTSTGNLLGDVFVELHGLRLDPNRDTPSLPEAKNGAKQIFRSQDGISIWYPLTAVLHQQGKDIYLQYWYLGDVGDASIASAAHPAHPQVDLQQIGSVLELALPMAHIKMHWRGWRGLRGLASVFNVFLEVGIRWRSLEWYQFGNMWKHKGADTKRSCLAAA